MATNRANDYLHRMAKLYWEDVCFYRTATEEELEDRPDIDLDPEETQRQLELHAVALKLNGWQTIWWDEDMHESVMDAYPEEVQELLSSARQ